MEGKVVADAEDSVTVDPAAAGVAIEFVFAAESVVPTTPEIIEAGAKAETSVVNEASNVVFELNRAEVSGPTAVFVDASVSDAAKVVVDVKESIKMEES